MKGWLRPFLLLPYSIWMAAWFWFFSFQYSSSFFRYHLDTRLPFLALSLLVVGVAPLSAFFFICRAVRKKLAAGRAALFHVLASAAPLGLFWFVYALRVIAAVHGDRLAFEADEAMGIGIDFMVCAGVVLLSCLVVGAVHIYLAIVRSESLRK